MLVFTLPAKRASERVEVWRKLKRMGALPFANSGYLLPAGAQNQEKFEWLAASIRRYQGQASVVQVHSIDDLPAEEIRRRFIEARSSDFRALARALNKIKRSRGSSAKLARLRRRFEEIAAIDFFGSPLASRVEAVLAHAAQPLPAPGVGTRGSNKKFHRRTWVTRHRPGIDRVSSAWLIRRFIDPAAKFVFASQAKEVPDAIPFDTFHQEGFGHRGDDCTFETLCKQFSVRDQKVATIAEIVHDADLDDAKFGRSEGIGLDRVLMGWAHQGLSDDELLRRGIEVIEGLYHGLN